MRKLILPLLVSLLVPGCVYEKPSQAVKEIQVGDPVPFFTVRGVNEGTFKTEQLTAKRSLIVFFVSTCPDCQRELPVLESAWRLLKEEPDCQFVAIGRGEGAAAVEKFWKEHDFSMPVYLDSDRSVFALFATSIVPRVYIVDTQGKVRWMAIEQLGLNAAEVAAKVKEQP